ncbi:MAG: hypothetical protein GY796_16900, partial [Chloroflexi bacterium]|nr:hypothetical protein [Chloroflexota bacterium]
KNPRLYLFSLSRYSPAIDQADPLNLNPGVPAPGGQTIIDYDVGNYFRPDGIDQFHYATRAADIGADEYIKDWGCAVEPTPQQATVVPGQTTVYYFTIQNTGHVYPPATGVPWHGYTDTITITLASSSQNWATLEGDGTIVTLDWRESVVRALTVTVPVTASNGMADVSNVRCTSSAMPSRTRDGSATTSVGLVTGVIVHPNYFANAAPGQVLTFTHTVKNVGNDTGDFIVLPDAGAQNAAAILLDNNGIPISQTKVTLDPTEFITTRLRVSILGTASIGGIAKPGVIAVEENNTANFGSALNNINIIQAPGTRYVAIGGTDNTNCTSPNQPCGTIQYAVDQAASGDEIHVANGTYTNTVTRTVQGNALVQNLFIDESVTIRGGYTTAENPPFVSNYPITQAAHLDGQLDHRVIYIAPNVTVTLSSLFIEKGEAFHDAFIPDRFYGGGVYNNGANLTITGTWFITNYGRYGAGLYQVGDNLRVNSSVFEHNNNRNNANLFGAGAGIMLTGTVQTAVIENNTFVANRVNEIGSLTSLSPTSLSNVDGSGGAIFASSGVLTLTNNIMDHNNGQSLATAVYISPTVVYTSNHNLFWDSRSSITFTNYISGPNSLFGDPTFLDTYYHIGPLSAAKDTGNSNTTYPWAVDFDLDARIMGSSIDIGADERIQRPNFIVVPISQTAVVTAGVPYTYTHILTNTGDNIDSYTLVMSNQQLPPGGTWNVSLLPPAQINNLGLMQSALITFVISGTDPGFMNLTTITATAASSNQQHTVQDTTTVRFTPGVDIAQSENGFGNSGQPISYTHTLTNTGNGIDRYSLQPIANNPAWIVSVQPTQTAFITTGGTMPFTVTVNVPPGTPANTVHQVQIEALSLSPISNTVRDTLTDTTTVTVSYGLALIPPTATLTVLDGATAVFNHSLQNTGNITDTANLTVTGVPTSWSISVQPLNMQLGLGQSKLVTVSVTVPVGSGGIVHTAVLTATSNGDPQVQATAVDTTTVQTSFGVQLEPDQQQIDDAGNTVLYNHTITNTGNAPDTFDLSGRSDLGWATSFTPGPISLTSGATDVVTVAVTIPLTATPGLQNTTVITAVSQTNSAAFDTATDQTRMRQNHGLILAPDRTGTTAPSSVISYMHWLTNTGNGLDTYTVTVSSSNGWGVAGPGLINLSSGQSASVMVTLTVPSGTSGSVDLMTVTAASIISPTFTDSVVNTTTVSGTPPTYGVLIAPDNTGSGQVNTIVQYQHTVTNSGTVMDNYTLNVVSQQGWTATVTPSSLTGISAGSTRSVTVDITILGNAAVGATDVATVTVTSQQSPTTFDTATDSTSVDQTFAVQLEPDRQQAGTAGTSVTYTHWLTNSGNGADSFNITAASSHGWVTNTPGLVSLSAGQSSQITITLDIPPAAGAMGAVTDTMQVTAASVGQPSVSAFVIDSTTIPSGSAGTVAVVIGPDNAQTVNPGDVAVYQHTITNTGTLTDDFRITAVSSQGYSIVTAPGSGSVVRLTPGQSTSVQVRVTVPTTATDGTVDTTTVTANSVSFSSISDDAANTTTIQTGPRLLFLPVILRLAGGATPTPTPTTSTSTATPSPTPCVATGIDLVVTQIQVTPNPPVGGQQATVFVTIHNQGSANMVSGNNFFLDFYIDRVPQPLLVGDIVWGIQGDDLTAGTSKTYSAPFTFTSGAHDLYAQVDTDGTVDECPNENNNVLGPNPITATGTSSNGQVGGNNVPLSSPRQTPPPAIAVETETPTILPPTAVPTETETPEQVGTVTPEIPSPTAVPTETETPEQIETVTPDATPPPDLEPAATTDLRLQPSPTPE